MGSHTSNNKHISGQLDTYLWLRLLEDRFGGLFKGAAELSLVSQDHRKESSRQFLPEEPSITQSLQPAIFYDRV